MTASTIEASSPARRTLMTQQLAQRILAEHMPIYRIKAGASFTWPQSGFWFGTVLAAGVQRDVGRGNKLSESKGGEAPYYLVIG